MKRTARFIIVAVAMAIVTVAFVACAKAQETYTLSEDKATYYYADFGSSAIDLPAVLDKGDNIVDASKYTWSVGSGDSAELVDGNNQIVLSNVDGVTVFVATVDKVTLEYTVTVVAGEVTFSSSLRDAKYSSNPGIAKKRVFGTKTIQGSTISAFSEHVTIIADDDYGNDDYIVSASDSSVLGYSFGGKNELNIEFKKAGTSVLRVELDEENEFGVKPSFTYTFNVVDGINVYNKEQLHAVQDLTTYNSKVDSSSTNYNTYSYNGYKGVDGTNFESVVVRDDIVGLEDVSLFYGNVYGNGYKLDATPYGTSTLNNNPNKYTNAAGGNTGQYSFYMMSDNTTIDNINLISDNTEYSSLLGYSNSKGVLGIFGVRETIEYSGVGNGANFDIVNSNTRMARNIKVLNSIIERGFKGLNVGGAPDETAPIWIESCVLRLLGSHGVFVETYIRFEGDGTGGTSKDPVKGQPAEDDFRAYVTIKNIIVSDTVFPSIGFMEANGAGGQLTYGSKITILGDKNYIFNWIKLSEADYGSIDTGLPGAVVVVKDEIEKALNDPANAELTAEISYYESDNHTSDNTWFNIGVFGNFMATGGDLGGLIINNDTIFHATKLDYSKSNLKDVWRDEYELNLKVSLLGADLEIMTPLTFAKIDVPAGAPSPKDDLKVVIPQRISEMTPATGN